MSEPCECGATDCVKCYVQDAESGEYERDSHDKGCTGCVYADEGDGQVSDTPQTDALRHVLPHSFDARPPRELARKLERENSDLRARVAALESEIKRVCKVLERHNGWSDQCTMMRAALATAKEAT